MNAQAERNVRRFAAVLVEAKARLEPNNLADFYQSLLERIEQIAGRREKENDERRIAETVVSAVFEVEEERGSLSCVLA